MADYRCYFLNDDRQIVAVEELSACKNDTEARETAIALLNERSNYSGIAVWERARKVFEELLPKVS